MKRGGRIRHEVKNISEMKTRLKESQMQINTMGSALSEIKDEKGKHFS